LTFTYFRRILTRRSASLRTVRTSVPPLPLPQKPRKIFVFPTSGTFVEAELAFAAIEFVGVHTTPPITACLVRDDRVQHFMIEDVLEKPERYAFLIEPGIDANDAILFLDRAENKILFRTFSAFAAPNHFV